MRRFAVPSAIARSTSAATLLLAATACASGGITLSTNSKPRDPNLLLSCARTVASQQGLAIVPTSAPGYELQAKSPVEPTTIGSAAVPSYDVLTVTLSPAKRGFAMLVGGASYVLRSLRGGASDAAKTEWVGTSPSARVGNAREAVLTQCGNLGT